MVVTAAFYVLGQKDKQGVYEWRVLYDLEGEQLQDTFQKAFIKSYGGGKSFKERAGEICCASERAAIFKKGQETRIAYKDMLLVDQIRVSWMMYGHQTNKVRLLVKKALEKK